MCLQWKTLKLLLLLLLSVPNAIGQENELLKAKIKVYANNRIPYGVETTVVLTMAIWPEYPITLCLSTARYMLAYCSVGTGAKDMPLKFIKTQSISKTLSDLKIAPTVKVEYQVGYYAEVKATFWDSSDRKLNLKGTVPTKPTINAVEVQVSIKLKMPSGCVPQLKMLRCDDPNHPQLVILKRSTMMLAYISKSCGMAKPKLIWNVMDLMETKLLKSYPDEELTFALKSFELRFPTDHELWRDLYVFQVVGNFNGKKFVGRCYVKSIMGQVEAVISGGAKRDATQSLVLHMDGSTSRDYSKKPVEKQFQTYQWNCHSHDDSYNKACHRNMTTADQFTIPANYLTVGCRYEFMLRVVADYNPNLSSRKLQIVSIVSGVQLEVAILCQLNCAMNLYNPMSKVKLMAKCYNCETSPINYEWYVGGQLTLTTSLLTMYIRTDSTLALIKLVITGSDGRRGSATMSLIKNVAPVSGNCAVEPKEGIEALTRFYVCCTKFITQNKPMEYFYYANRVLVNRCSSCNCASFLPLHLSTIKVLICDNFMTCCERYVPVKVKPLPEITVESPQDVWAFLTTGPDNVVEMASQGRSNRLFQVIQSLASRTQSSEIGMVLMRAYKDVYPQSIPALGKLANLTQTFASQLTPINATDQELLVESVKKLNEIFEKLYKNQFQKLLTTQPFINVTIACVTVYDLMTSLNKQLPRPPQSIFDEYKKAFLSNKLEQPVIDKLLEEISYYEDDGVRQRSLLWVNSHWETEILYRHLYYARKHGLQADPNNVVSAGVSLEIQCFQINPIKHYEIDTKDGMHTVFFSPELIQEMKSSSSDHICLKVISTIRELNWWYPEEKQPSIVLLSVRIYVTTDNFKHEIELEKSDIRFKTIVGKLKPALDLSRSTNKTNLKDPKARDMEAKPEVKSTSATKLEKTPRLAIDDEDQNAIADTGKYINCLEDGFLNTMQQVRMYRVNLDEHAIIAVVFTHSSHKLKVLLLSGDPPKALRKEVAKSKCFVPANSTNTVMLLRNNCMEVERAYMAVQVFGGSRYEHEVNTSVLDGPATFSFVFQVRSCDYWMYTLPSDEQRWSHDHCLPVLEFHKKGSMHCVCTVLGTYTSYVYHVPVILVPIPEYFPVAINWLLILAYLIVLILLITWLVCLLLWYNVRPNKTVVCDMAHLEDDSPRDIHDLLIFLKTGGRLNSKTTATVRIIFQTTQRTETQFTLMQDPENPVLTRNSTYVLWLRTRNIRIPTRVAVSHNNAGRYPTWYLRRIEVMDVQAQLTQVFLVHRWVRQKFLVLSSSMVLKPGDQRVVGSWRERFATEFERLWINWGLWQPLFGNWRDRSCDSLTRSQRCCVFASKMLAIYTICACYMGPTTAESVYEDRKTLLVFSDVIIMFVLCVVITNLIHYMFEYFAHVYPNEEDQ